MSLQTIFYWTAAGLYGGNTPSLLETTKLSGGEGDTSFPTARRHARGNAI